MGVDEVMTTYWIVQHRGSHREFVYQTTSKPDAYDFIDIKNEHLAERGIPSDVCYWAVDPEVK